MKRKKGSLRLNAAFAKSRLVTGYWNQQHRKTGIDDTSNYEIGREQRRADIYNFYTNIDSEEEILYRRIAAQILSGESDNLLGSVLDKEHMATLGETERQRYVFNMSSLVQKSV